jgi:transposase-like protein
MARRGAPRNGAKERSWRRLIQQWRRSGMTIRDFCVEHEVSEPSFFAWRRTIADRDRQSGQPSADGCGNGDSNKTRDSPAFVPLRVVSTVSPTPAGTAGTAGTAFEVVLRDGRIVRVPAGFDPATLRQLLAILERERGDRPC